MTRQSVLLAILLGLAACTATAQPDVDKDPASESTSTGDEAETPWLDTGRDYVIDRADNLAAWMDNFFGDAEREGEAPYSTLRLRLEQDWDQEEGHDDDLKLRGKLYLPKFNERLSLLFSDDDDKTGNEELLIDERRNPDDVALQYTAREKKHYRLDFKVGLRSSLALKTSMRYRYEYPFTDTWLGRASEEVFYYGDDGFGSRTRIELDKILDDRRVVQWRNQADWEEEEPGVEWDTSLALYRRLDDNRAISYYTAVSGETRPDPFTASYSLGVRYRQNFLRPWLFLDVQPYYSWRKNDAEDNRYGSAGLRLRLEAVFEKDFSRKKKK